MLLLLSGIFNEALLIYASCFSVSVFQIPATLGFFFMYVPHLLAFSISPKIYAYLSNSWAGTRFNGFHFFYILSSNEEFVIIIRIFISRDSCPVQLSQQKDLASDSPYIF